MINTWYTIRGVDKIQLSVQTQLRISKVWKLLRNSKCLMLVLFQQSFCTLNVDRVLYFFLQVFKPFYRGLKYLLKAISASKSRWRSLNVHLWSIAWFGVSHMRKILWICSLRRSVRFSHWPRQLKLCRDMWLEKLFW